MYTIQLSTWQSKTEQGASILENVYSFLQGYYPYWNKYD